MRSGSKNVERQRDSLNRKIWLGMQKKGCGAFRCKRGADQCGAAMIAVLCVMAVFVALAFAILLAAASAAAAMQRTLPREKCKIMAVSLSDVLTQEMGEADGEENSLQGEIRSSILKGEWEQSGDLAHIFETLGAEDEKSNAPDSDDGKKYFEVEDVPEDYQAQIVMAWGIPEEESGPEEEDTGISRSGIRLYAAVDCSLRGQTCRVKSRYVLREGREDGKEKWRWELEWRE